MRLAAELSVWGIGIEGSRGLDPGPSHTEVHPGVKVRMRLELS